MALAAESTAVPDVSTATSAGASRSTSKLEKRRTESGSWSRVGYHESALSVDPKRSYPSWRRRVVSIVIRYSNVMAIVGSGGSGKTASLESGVSRNETARPSTSGARVRRSRRYAGPPSARCTESPAPNAARGSCTTARASR
jgi:hypothetical protein